MSVEKLERVLWRLRKQHKDAKFILNQDLRRAIMLECGTSPACYQQNRRALFALKWIKSNGRYSIKLTNNDITGDYE